MRRAFRTHGALAATMFALAQLAVSMAVAQAAARSGGPAAVALGPSSTAAPAPSAALRVRTVEGAGGVPLNVVEAGNPKGPGILLVHGIGQSHLSFDRQLRSPELTREFHLVAFDLRGHGNSGKPWRADDYKDTAIWAEDVARVMAATGLVRPVLIGWSYGTLVSADYVRHRGTANLSGILLTGALGGLMPPPPPPPGASTPEAAAARERGRAAFSSDDLAEALEARRAFVDRLTAKPMPEAWRVQALQVQSLLPPHVYRHLWLRNVANTDLVARIDVPLLVIGGSADPSVPGDQARELMTKLRAGSLSIYEGNGHSPFAEEPERFNAELAAFVRRVARVTK